MIFYRFGVFYLEILYYKWYNKLIMEKNLDTKTQTLSTNKIFLPLMFILFSLIFECANFLYLGFTDANGGVLVFPTYFLFDLAIIFMLAGIIFLVQKKRIMNIIFFLFLFIQFALNIINTTMYSVFGDVLSWDLLKLGAEATTAITMDFIDWGGIFLNLGLFIIMIVAVILLQKYNKTSFKIKYFSFPVLVLAVFIFSQSINVCLFQAETMALESSISAEKEIETSDKYLWDNFQFKIEAYKKFGHFGFYTKLTLDLLSNESLAEDEKENYVNYINEGHVNGNKNAPLYNDNLIVILCESVDTFAFDPYNTPTLWKLYQGYHSVVFQNFRARNRTNISEGVTLLGSMPKNTMMLDMYNKNYQFAYSLPNLFKSAGEENVVTRYFHPNTEKFYDRYITHNSDGIGFDETFFIEDYTGLQVQNYFGDWISDLDYTQNLMDKILPKDQRFLSYITTLSTHGPYTEDNPKFKDYYDIFDSNLENFTKWHKDNTNFVMPNNDSDFQLYRRYKSQVIDFDKMVENLINELDERGLSQKTSILFYADHNAYYHDLTYKIKGVEKEDFSNTEVNHIPMFLYSPKIADEQGVNISDFCNTYDILPTLCDLYGMDSNNNLFQGYSIFGASIKNSVFSSHLGGIFTDNIYSQNIAQIQTLDEDVSSEDVERFKRNASKYYEKLEHLEIIYGNAINGTLR